MTPTSGLSQQSPRRVLVTGASGLIGRAVTRALLLRGAEVIAVTRDASRARDSIPYPVTWLEHDLNASPLPSESVRGVDAVVHLAGESIAGRWTEERKRAIRDSRVMGTENLLRSFAASERPSVWVGASAIGIYGDRGEESLDESSSAGAGFLAEVTRDWEAAFLGSGSARTERKVALRFGVVLSREGGILARLRPLFRSGLAGPIGGWSAAEKIWMSWIHLDDAAALVLAALDDERYSGPINAVAPDPVSSAEWTRSLGRAVERPVVLPAPAPAVRLGLGEMSELVLASQRVRPTKALEMGFSFRYPKLDDALESFSLADEELFAEQWVPTPVEQLWPFFADAKNLEAITPDSLSFRIIGMSTPEIRQGTLIDYRLRLHRVVPLRWRTEIAEYDPPRRFVDVQLSGPYRKWHHEHEFFPLAGGTLLVDRVRYRLPAGALGQALAGAWVRSDVRQIFSYRRGVIAERFGGPRS